MPPDEMPQGFVMSTLSVSFAISRSGRTLVGSARNVA
jgi:hypothetical protein